MRESEFMVTPTHPRKHNVPVFHLIIIINSIFLNVNGDNNT